jgi:hypothetical protein
MRDGTIVAIVGRTRVDYVDPGALRESLRFEVMRKLLAEDGAKAGPDAIGKPIDEASIASAVSALERDIAAESNAHLQKVAADRARVDDRIRQLREELERLEGRPRAPAAALPVAQGQFDPATNGRVCPSPLLGKVLYGASGPRCVSDDMTLYSGSLFGEKAEWVCARCTPNCVFAPVEGGRRLICVVPGWVPPKLPTIGNPSGSWRPAPGSSALVTITGGGPGYHLTGTDGHYKHEGTITGDGTKFEGALKDVPGFCCGREGYVWMEAVDASTYRARSVWWTPGQGSREKPQLTYGWTTFTRGTGAAPAGAPAAASAAPPALSPEELAARKKAVGDELNRVRIEGRWSPDHHYQVGTFIGNARTGAALGAIEALIRDYAGCYATKNAAADRIQAAARAGQYPTPGDRVDATNKVTAVFNQCIDAALARWRGAGR